MSRQGNINRNPISTPRAAPHSQSIASFQMKAAAEKPKQADDDQINGNDIIQQPGHNQNENASDERHKRADTQIQIHGASFFFRDMQPRNMRSTVPK
jgi:hypothetical protein